ncbi:MAG: thioesterase II family protein [Prochloraceae cyanobacterium]
MLKTSPSNTSWIAYSQTNPQAQLRLFCFPFAGGSASVFRDWQASLPQNIQVCPIELPGRGSRLLESPLENISSLITGLITAIEPLLDLPFVLFGHSLGALISFELARYLRQEYGKVPLHLLVSGRQAPPIDDLSPMHALSDADLIAELHRLDGTPKAVLESPEMLQLLLPMVRADLKIDETYKYITSEPLSCAVSVFGGLADPETSLDDLEAWRQQTQGEFSLQMFPGNHFFINTARDLLLERISQILSVYISNPS